MTPAETKAAMTKWKVPVKYYKGWETRGRRAFGEVHGIVIHHTGSDSQSDDYLSFLFVGGRPAEGIPAPLCNASTDMDGDIWIGAALVANHAGAGSSRTRDHVIAEDYAGYASELKPGPDDMVGNASNGMYYGNEVRFDGGQPMTDKQWNAAVLWAAAICDHYGWSGKSVIGHREHSSRKPDPGSTKMYVFRAAVNARLIAGPPGAAKPPTGATPDAPGGTMAFDAGEITQIRAAVQAELEEYFVRFFIAPTGTGTGMRNDISDIKNTVHRIEDDVDGTP
jgi:hypothetical protein